MVEPTCRVSPPTNPVPEMVRTWGELDPVNGFGKSPVMTGGGPGATTWRFTVFEGLPSGLITWTAWSPGVRPVTGIRSCALPTYVICEPPNVADPTLTVAPDRNPVPLMIRFWTAADALMGFGLIEAMTGDGGPPAVQFWTSAAASTEPHPVARSKPAPALNPVRTPTAGAAVEQFGEPPTQGTALVPELMS